jgi:hypothetical protein
MQQSEHPFDLSTTGTTCNTIKTDRFGEWKKRRGEKGREGGSESKIERPKEDSALINFKNYHGC